MTADVETVLGQDFVKLVLGFIKLHGDNLENKQASRLLGEFQVAYPAMKPLPPAPAAEFPAKTFVAPAFPGKTYPVKEVAGPKSDADKALLLASTQAAAKVTDPALGLQGLQGVRTQADLYLAITTKKDSLRTISHSMQSVADKAMADFKVAYEKAPKA
jgi:hypothetical protein